MKIMLNEGQYKQLFKENKQILKEFISNPMISLKKYFEMSEDEKKSYLPHTYPYLLEPFRKSYDKSDKEYWLHNDLYNYLDDGTHPTNIEDFEYVEALEKTNPTLFNEFADWIYEGLVNYDFNDYIAAEDYPAWTYFDKPTLVKNQWMIHFTNDANSISKDGFKYGVSEVDKLALTTKLSEFDKKYGGYNFSYLLKDMGHGNLGGGRFKYGNEAVLFKASGVRMWHNGDNENQTIFYGNTATDIIPIYTNGDEIYVKNMNTGKILFQSEYIDTVVKWITTNYSQYRTVLHK